MSIFYVVVGLLNNIIKYSTSSISFHRNIYWRCYESGSGGTGGYIIARAVQYGITRGMYSNEAEKDSTICVSSAII